MGLSPRPLPLGFKLVCFWNRFAAMTNPLIHTLNRITQMEADMNEQANDRIEGYADGMAGHWQSRRSDEYNTASEGGAFDRAMLAMAAEWKRRAGLAAPSENG